MKPTIDAKLISEDIPGYTYGGPESARSPISVTDLERLKQTLGFTEEDRRYLKLAGEILGGQTGAIVDTWRGIIAKSPHLARHVKDTDGNPIPGYSERSRLRFQQWILDTCFRPYDQDWLNYQQEIALRHTRIKKNKTDGVPSTAFVPLRDIVAFTSVMNETIKPFLSSTGHPADEVEKMHQAWRKAVQLQIALWTHPYASSELAPDQW